MACTGMCLESSIGLVVAGGVNVLKLKLVDTATLSHTYILACKHTYLPAYVHTQQYTQFYVSVGQLKRVCPFRRTVVHG